MKLTKLFNINENISENSSIVKLSTKYIYELIFGLFFKSDTIFHFSLYSELIIDFRTGFWIFNSSFCNWK